MKKRLIELYWLWRATNSRVVLKLLWKLFKDHIYNEKEQQRLRERLNYVRSKSAQNNEGKGTQ